MLCKAFSRGLTRDVAQAQSGLFLMFWRSMDAEVDTELYLLAKVLHEDRATSSSVFAFLAAALGLVFSGPLLPSGFSGPAPASGSP